MLDRDSEAGKQSQYIGRVVEVEGAADDQPDVGFGIGQARTRQRDGCTLRVQADSSDRRLVVCLWLTARVIRIKVQSCGQDERSATMVDGRTDGRRHHPYPRNSAMAACCVRNHS